MYGRRHPPLLFLPPTAPDACIMRGGFACQRPPAQSPRAQRRGKNDQAGSRDPNIQAGCRKRRPSRDRCRRHDGPRSPRTWPPEGAHRGLPRQYTVDLIPKIKLELVLADDLVEKAVQTIVAAARTGKIGDGKI